MKNPYQPIPETEMYIPRTPSEEVYIKMPGITSEDLAKGARCFNSAIKNYDNINALRAMLGKLNAENNLAELSGLVTLMQERIENFSEISMQDPNLKKFSDAVYDRLDELGL